MSGLLRSDPARDTPRALRELAEQLEALLYTTARQLVPLLGARWVEVSRAAPTGTPRTFARASGAQDATRDLAVTVAEHRIPHPLGRTPEGVLVVRNTAGSVFVEGAHDKDFLVITPYGDTTLRLLVF